MILPVLTMVLLTGPLACQPTPAPSVAGVADTSPAFMPPGSSLEGARRVLITVTPNVLEQTGSLSSTFTLVNRSSKTVILASVVTASEHVSATSPGAMPYRVDPGKSFSVEVVVTLPWDHALVDGGLARVLTTEGETIELWLQLATAEQSEPSGS